MRSPGNAVAFWARKNCTVAAQTRTRMERFIFFASSLYKFRLHLHHPYSSSFAKNLHFPTPHPCPLLEPAFARLRRGRRRGEVPKCQARRGSPSGHATRWIGRSAGDARATRLRRHCLNIEVRAGLALGTARSTTTNFTVRQLGPKTS